MKAKESSESAANEENHSENGDAKVNAVCYNGTATYHIFNTNTV